MSHIARVCFVLAILVAGLSGCGDSKAKNEGGEGTSTSKVEGGTRIEIKDYKFEPVTLKAKVGDTITVKNLDSEAEHTVTASDKSFDTGPLKLNQSATFKVTTAGTFNYVCSIHPYMAGTIVVEP